MLDDLYRLLSAVLNRQLNLKRRRCQAALSLALIATAASLQAEAQSDVATILERLERLEQELEERDRQIAELKAEVSALVVPDNRRAASIERAVATTASPQPAGSPPIPVTSDVDITPDNALAAQGATPDDSGEATFERPTYFGEFQRGGAGIRVANTRYGDISLGSYLQARYTNQLGLDEFYTDAFGRTREVDRRNDFQLNKVSLQFQGWMLVPNLRYLAYAWTSNSNLGNSGQVTVAGNLAWVFDNSVTLGVGVNGLPGTRSMEGNWPRWNRVDTRLMADEFMRPSFTTGLYSFGELGRGFSYKVMLGNNLSQLGVNAVELNDNLDTFAGALIWSPMGHYPNSFGDFEYSQSPVTRVAVHYTHSTEDRQSQPNEDDLENTQLRLSDGTLLFDNFAFGTPGRINEARYQMTALDAGVKYRGFALEGEYFLRRLDNFETIGSVPVTKLIDHGVQLQASMMLVPETWQAYLGASKVFGDYGNPWDAMLGVNWFPLNERRFRINTELLYVRNSPTGNQTLPYGVGNNGPIFHLTAELSI